MDISKLNIEDLVKYFNLELKKDHKLSVNKLCDKLGIKKGTLKSRMSKFGYTYDIDNRKYIKPSDIKSDTSKPKEVIELPKEVSQDRVQEVPQEDIQQVSHEVSQQGAQEVPQEVSQKILPIQAKEKGLFINNNIDVLIEMIQKFKGEKDSGDIVIKLPYEEVKDYKMNARINKKVWEEFKSFCSTKKEFTQKELLSQALLNFINEYK